MGEGEDVLTRLVREVCKLLGDLTDSVERDALVPAVRMVCTLRLTLRHDTHDSRRACATPPRPCTQHAAQVNDGRSAHKLRFTLDLAIFKKNSSTFILVLHF